MEVGRWQGLGWIIAGLALLRRLLLESFPDGVTAVTLVAVLLGTNLYHYATFDSSYSHPYSFFLFTAFMCLASGGTRRRENGRPFCSDWRVG